MGMSRICNSMRLLLFMGTATGMRRMRNDTLIAVQKLMENSLRK